MKMYRRIFAALFVLVLCLTLSLPVHAAKPDPSCFGVVAIITGGTDERDYLAVCVEEDGNEYVYSGIRPIQDQIAAYVSLTSDYDFNSIYLFDEDIDYEGPQGIFRFELGECIEQGTSADVFPEIARVSKKDTVYFVNLDQNETIQMEKSTVSSVRNGSIKTSDGLEKEYGSGEFVVIFNSDSDVVGFCKDGKAYAADSKSGSGFSAAWLTALIPIVIGTAVGFLLRKKKKQNAAPEIEDTSDGYAGGPDEEVTVMEDEAGANEVFPGNALRLKCRGGYMNGRIYPIPREGITIGREPDNNIQYPANTPGISRHHVKLFWQDGQLMILDLESSNGTYLNRNGRIPAMRPVPLNPGDCFYLGENKNGFEITVN